MSDLDIVSTPAASDIPASTPDPAISGPTATPTATPTGTSATAPTTPSSEGMVPSYRIRETREAAIREAQQQWGTREADYQAQLRQVQQQLHALVGVAPDQNPQETAIRSQFEQLFPGLAKLEARSQDLLGVVDRSGDLDAQNKHYWSEYGRQRLDSLYAKAGTALGAPLNEKGKSVLKAAFIGYVTSSPELAARYEKDPTVVDEYWADFGSNFIDPVRRTASATVDTQIGVRAIPRDTPSGAPQVTAAPKAKDLDERAAQAWASYNLTKK